MISATEFNDFIFAFIGRYVSTACAVKNRAVVAIVILFVQRKLSKAEIAD